MLYTKKTWEIGDINRRRGQVNDMGDRAGAKTIKADVPLSEMFGYVTTLRTLSSGSNIYYGIFTLRETF
jgi:translation elongation factor EF-G